MQRINKHKLNCDNCIFGDQECRSETNNQKCKYYCPIDDESENMCIELLIDKNRREYIKEFEKYIGEYN